MENVLVCRFFNGLLDPDSPPVPVWGTHDTLAHLTQALESGLQISWSISTTSLSESDHAIATIESRLQTSGIVPNDIQTVQDLSDEQRVALRFEPRLPPQDVQNMGTPPFKSLNVADFLASLRFSARMQQLQTGSRPIFQLGILTMTVHGSEQQFFAQTLMAEAGQVTNTLWLYRWCIMSLNGQYEEHWRAFDGHMSATSYQAVRPNLAQTTPIKTPPQPQHRPRTKRTGRPSHRFQNFQHQHLTDSELFRAPSDLIQGAAILRLANSYSNQEIFDRINAVRPGGVRSVNVVTKRLTHAVQAAAKASGSSVSEVRARILEAKKARGVKNKSKVDITPYG